MAKLIIKNLDSQIILTKEQIELSEDILFGKTVGARYEEHGMMEKLAETVPVYLISEETMQHFDDDLKKKCLPLEEESRKDHIEWLGFFTGRGKESLTEHDVDFPVVAGPAIFLCPWRIVWCAKKENDYPCVLAKVLVHEFAHALMHPDAGKDYAGDPEFYKWVEEPFANAITLEFFETWANYLGAERKEWLDLVCDFIRFQPKNYQLGFDFYKYGISYWRLWREIKAGCDSMTEREVEWLNVAQGQPGNGWCGFDLRQLMLLWPSAGKKDWRGFVRQEVKSLLGVKICGQLVTQDTPEQVWNGNFRCSGFGLTSLKYAPKFVTGFFDCSNNKLTSFEYAPKEVGCFFCNGNAGAVRAGKSLFFGARKDIHKCQHLIVDLVLNEGILGLFLISGMNRVDYLGSDNGAKSVFLIVNKYLKRPSTPHRLYECQDELIEAGFENYALI